MDTFECIVSRRSVRRYDKKDVPNELIGQIIYAGTQAPSAGNLQPWEFIIVKDEKTKKELSLAALRQNFIYEAPVVIVVCADPEKSEDRYGERGKNLYCIQDTAAAIQNMLLTANNLGLGSCWVGAFEEEKVKDILNIPERLRPIALLPVGFPLKYEEPSKKRRLGFESITWVDKHGKGFPWIDTRTGGEWHFVITPLEQQIKKLKEKLALKKK